MRLSSLCVAAVLLFSPVAFAQHSSGGSGSSSASSSSSGGGSHSSSSGGSSSSGSSGASHSSGGSVSSTSSAHSSGGSVSHVSSARSSNSTSVSPHPVAHDPHSNALRTIREPNAGAPGKTEPSEKKSFFSFLRHPFRRPSPKPEPPARVTSNLRRWICVSGQAGGRCTGKVNGNGTRAYCQAGEFSSGGDCLLQTRFMDDCLGRRRIMEQQARRMQAAQSAQQSACASGSSQDCSTLTGTAQSEANLYRTLQDQYQTCRRRSQAAYSFTGFGFSGYSSGLSFEPLEFDVNYR